MLYNTGLNDVHVYVTPGVLKLSELLWEWKYSNCIGISVLSIRAPDILAEIVKEYFTCITSQ